MHTGIGQLNYPSSVLMDAAAAKQMQERSPSSEEIKAAQRQQRSYELMQFVQQVENMRERLPALGLEQHDDALDALVLDTMKQWMKSRKP